MSIQRLILSDSADAALAAATPPGTRGTRADYVSALLVAEDARLRRALRLVDWPREDLVAAIGALRVDLAMPLADVPLALLKAELSDERLGQACLPNTARALLDLAEGWAMGVHWLRERLAVPK